MWAALVFIVTVYVGGIYYSPTAFYWSLIPTFLMAVPFTTVYQHRYGTHRAMKMAAWLENFLEGVGAVCIGYNTPGWVAAHDNHHHYSDKPGDTHSPHWIRQEDGTERKARGIEGLIPAILPHNVFAWKRWLNEHPDKVPKLASHVLARQNGFTRFLQRHNLIGLPFGIGALCLMAGLENGLIASGLHLITFVFILNPLINGLCHYQHRWLLGYQNSQIPTVITTWNNWWVALLTAGEGFHNNHHRWLARAMLANKWWELPADWGFWAVILPTWLVGATWDIRVTEKLVLPRINIVVRKLIGQLAAT